MGSAIRAFDWSKTPLGPIATWPPSLRIAASICLGSRLPMFVWWGRELINLYNDAYAPILGKRHPEALGRPAREIWHEIWDVVGPQADAVMLRGEATWNERVLLMMERHGYAEETYFTWSYSPIHDETGAIVGLFCACTEETAHVLAERERAWLAEQRQLALDAAQMGSWHHDPATGVSRLDARYREIFGLTGELRTNEELFARLHPDDRARVIAAIGAALDPAAPAPYAIQFRIYRDDGAMRWIEAHGMPTFAGHGAARRAVSFVGTVTDVTERKEAEAAARRIAERDQFLIALDNATRALDDPHAITQVSAQMLRAHLRADRTLYADVDEDGEACLVREGYTVGAPGVAGRYVIADFGEHFARQMHAGEPSVVDDIDADPAVEGVREAWRAVGAIASVAVPLHKAGRLVAMIVVHSASPRRWRPEEVELIEQVGNRCWESIQRAVVERSLREALEAERYARAEAELANRTKDEFLATLSHELRTPLNAILGWSQIVRTDSARADALAKGLAAIDRNARLQARIIEDLLDMSGIISGKIRLEVQRVDLVAVVQGAVETVRPAADAKGVALRSALDGAAATVKGDPGRLQQVMWNLLSNAVKFTPRGGSVDVTIARAGHEVELTVTDTGEGMRADFLPFAFDRFRQADGSTTRRHGGLGLGLSIVKQLVELHGGRVAARSGGPGQGSTFTVALPLCAPATGA